jgi:hypothetical protein
MLVANFTHIEVGSIFNKEKWRIPRLLYIEYYWQKLLITIASNEWGWWLFARYIESNTGESTR